MDVPGEVADAQFRFWTDALGSTTSRPAVNYPGTYSFVGTVDHLRLGVQRLEDGDLRWHFDLGAATPGAGAERVRTLGARTVDESHDGWVVLRDPAGLLFCTVREPNHLWLDVPSDLLDATVAFWSAALGREAVPEPGDEDTYFLLGTTGAGVTVGVQRLDDERLDDGEAHSEVPRWHVDIETDDVPAEVARMLELGATVDRAVDSWQILRDPAGQPFCVVQVQTEGFADAARVVSVTSPLASEWS